MRDVSELTEHEAELVNRLIEVYPGGLGYSRERVDAVDEVAAILIPEGRVERIEHTARLEARGDELVETGVKIMVTYRLTDQYAAEVRRTAEERARRAKDN